MTNYWSPSLGGGSGSGDVTGPASSTDNAVVRFNGTTGKLLQNSVVIISDTGVVTGVTDLSLSRYAAGSTATIGAGYLWSASETLTDFTGASTWNGQSVALVLNPSVDLTAGNAKTIRGLSSVISVNSGNTKNFTTNYGTFLSIDHAGTGTVDTQVGLYSSSILSDNGNVTTNYGAYISAGSSGFSATGDITNNYVCYLVPINDVAGSVLTNSYSCYIDTPISSGTITNSYGLYIADQNVGTNKWAIKTNAGLVYFGDDVQGISRFAFGSDATFGLSGGYDKLWDLAATTTDFSSSTSWDGLRANWKIDSTVNLGATAVTGYDFSTSIKSGNTKDYLFITGNYFGAFHNGTGTVTNQQAAIAVAQSLSSGDITNNYGFGAIANPAGTGSVTTNVAFYATSGHSGAGGSITNDYSVYVTSPNNARTMTVHRGIYIADQAFGTTSHAIYSEGGQSFFLGNVGIGAGKTAPATALDVNGTVTATAFNGNTITAGTGTLTLAASKTLTASNTLTLTGTDGSSVAFGTGGTVAYTANKLSVFAATTSSELAGVISDETGSGSLVFATSPTLVTPTIGVASATSINFGGGALSDYVPPTVFTPTVTLVGGAGNTVPQYVSNSGRYTQIGKRVFVDVLLSGDGGNEGAGTGQVNVALPVNASASAVGQRTPCGYYINGGTATMLGGTVSASASTITLTVGQGTTSLTGADQNNTTRAVSLRFDYEV